MNQKVIRLFPTYLFIILLSSLLIIVGCARGTLKTYTFKKTIGKEGEAIGEFNGPIGLTIDSQGFIYISDSGNNRIQKFSAEGVFIKSWGTKGTEKGKMNRPMHMSIGPDGNLYVAE